MYDELDILREVGSIAAAHGSIALSEILGRKINLSVPTIDIIPSVGFPTKINIEKIGTAVIAKLLTGLKGNAIILLSEKDAIKLIDLSYKVKKEDKRLGVLTEMGLSLIKEVEHIVISAYISALSMMLKRLILISPPILISGEMDEIIRMVLADSKDNDYSLLIETIFKESEENIEGSFYLILTPKAASDIKKACKDILKELESSKGKLSIPLE